MIATFSFFKKKKPIATYKATEGGEERRRKGTRKS
jgi:hypothetical protein